MAAEGPKEMSGEHIVHLFSVGGSIPCFLIVFVLLFQADAFWLKASSGSGNQHTQEETFSSKEVPHGMSISDHHNAAIHQSESIIKPQESC